VAAVQEGSPILVACTFCASTMMQRFCRAWSHCWVTGSVMSLPPKAWTMPLPNWMDAGPILYLLIISWMITAMDWMPWTASGNIGGAIFPASGLTGIWRRRYVTTQATGVIRYFANQ